MKKIFSLLLCATFVLASCGSDDDGGRKSGSFGIEEGKAKLEDNSVEILKKIEAFENDSALQLIVELAEFLSRENDTEFKTTENTALKSITNIASVAEDGDVFAMNVNQLTTIAAEESLLADFDDETGIYQWNETIEDFEKIGESSDIIYNVSYNGKTAVFSFTDFNATIINSDLLEDELPTLAKLNLKINNTVVFSQDYNATFEQGKAVPIAMNNTLKIGEFSFVVAHTKTANTVVDQSFSFNIGDEAITAYALKANGDFSTEEGLVEDIVDNATVSFTFLDAVLSLTANANIFSDSALSLSEEVNLLNSNVNGELSIEGKSIAKTQFYEDQDSINARFLFEDTTTADFGVYIDGSFGEVEAKFEEVFDAYERLFANVDL